MANNIEWRSLITRTFLDQQTQNKQLEEVVDHPLKINNIHVKETPSKSVPSSIFEPLNAALEGLDPLTQFAKELDPLTKMAVEMEDYEEDRFSFNKSNKSKAQKTALNIEPWSSRKSAILAKFTTSEKLSIVTSFLAEGEKVVVKAQSSAVDKVQHRLEQLDNFEEGSQRKLDLSQAEYVSRIEQLNRELVSAWNSEQKVKALRIVIQCAKLLADTDVMRFYPSKFVLITDILDIFGQLVYDRLRTKADYLKPGAALPEEFTPEMVPESAKETCRNWFFKIASIRELVPRFYVEMALLRCYNFLSRHEGAEALQRLTQMVQGVGNPLVAVYARCYLCRVGINVAPPNADKRYLLRNFANFLDCYSHLFSRCVKQDLTAQRIDTPTYMTLFTPALDFILQAVACDAPETLLADLLAKCKQKGSSPLILNTIMAAFKPNLIALRATQFLQMIEQCSKDDLPQHLLLRTLGLCVSVFPPPSEQQRQVLAAVWKFISGLSVAEQYISCAEVWMQFTVQCFGSREINAVIGDLVEHMAKERAYEQHYPQLKLIVERIIAHIPDFEALLAIDNFLPLIDLFKQETIKVEVCKKILSACSSEQKTCDPVVINALMFLCTVLHDSVNALSVDDERRQIGEILCNTIRRIDYGRDFEQQLSFYVEARGSFSNIDAVLYQLVQCVCTLAMKTRQIVKGHHTRKTADFVRACAAYCFITIPGMISIRARLDLYLLSGKVALYNQCLGQADACFKAALSIIPELEEETETDTEIYLKNYTRNFLASLLIVPDNPERGVLNLTRLLLNILQKFKWSPQNATLTTLYLDVLDLLSTMAQETFPYHVDKVDSNDTLYGSDPKFILEVNKMCTVVLGQILAQLKQLGSGRKQSQLALETVVRLGLRADLNESAMQTLILNLWQLCVKNGNCDLKYLRETKEYLRKRSISTSNLILQQVLKKFVIPQ